MIKTIRSYQTISICLLLIAFLLLITSSHAKSPESRLKAIEKDLIVLNKKQSIDTAQRDDINTALKETELLINELHLALDKLGGQIQTNTVTLQTLGHEKAPLESEFKTQQALLLKQLTLYYQLGKHQYLKLILNQRDPMLTSRLLSYMAFINQSRAQTLEKLAKLKKEIDEKRSKIEAQTTKLKTLKTEQVRDEKLLKEEINHQTALIKALNKTLSTRQEKITRMLKDKARLQVIIDNLNRKKAFQRRHNAFSQMRHRLPWPVEGVLISHFGELGEDITHHGVTINAPEGKTIYAIHGGKVVFADWLKGFGLLIIINHGQGYMTLYANNQALYAKRDDIVEAGDVIAKIGHTGGQLEDGLYFEIRYNGKPLNPTDWLSASKDSP